MPVQLNKKCICVNVDANIEQRRVETTRVEANRSIAQGDLKSAIFFFVRSIISDSL